MSTPDGFHVVQRKVKKKSPYEMCTDQNTVFAVLDQANKEELMEILKDFVTRCKEENYGYCNYLVNYIESRNIAYIYMSNPKIRNILVGLQPDGSDNVAMVPDDSWVPPEHIEDLVLPPYPETSNWSDIEDHELLIARMVKEHEEKTTPPMIEVVINESLPKPKSYDTYEGSDEEMFIAFNQCMAPELESKFEHNILTAWNVPKSARVEDFEKIFQKYAKRPTDKAPDMNGDLKPFPHIYLNRGTVFIVFDPNTTDARFACIMQKFTTVHGKSLAFKHVLKSKNPLNSKHGSRR